MALTGRCSICRRKVPARQFITRRKRIVTVIYCPRCDVAQPAKGKPR